jgi:two-component system NtrC family sensor kinase
MRNTLATIKLNGTGGTSHVGPQPSNAAMLGRADRLANVGQLAAGLAHEMNTPLGSISGHAEESLDILEHLGDGPLQHRQIADLRGRLLAIMRQANRCSHIATRLLQIAQPGRPTGATCQPSQVVDAVVELFIPASQENGIRFERSLGSELPDAPIGPADLEQLLVNLVQNSLDACVPGDTVRIDVTSCNGQLQFVVSDTGCGIERDTLNRIFDPFFTTKPVGQGTGLGLSVCLGIVRSVGGSIEVESGPGCGTRVTIMLPVRPARRAVVASDALAPYREDRSTSISLAPSSGRGGTGPGAPGVGEGH